MLRPRLFVSGFLAVLLAGPASARGKKPASEAEVEIYATLSSKVGASSLVLLASSEPCAPTPSLRLYGSARAARGGSAFVEVFVPQGSPIHICGAGLDAQGRLVAWGQYEKNPVKGEGQGEVTFSGVTIDLKPLPKPVPAPAGL